NGEKNGSTNELPTDGVPIPRITRPRHRDFRQLLFMPWRTAAVAFLAGLNPFGFEAARVRSAGRFCGTPLDRFADSREQHCPQPRQAILAVAVLVARALAGQNQFARGRQARSVA